MADTARNRALEDERRRLAAIAAWGGPVRDYTLSRTGGAVPLDITRNRNMAIENAPSRDNVSEINALERLLGISSAKADTPVDEWLDPEVNLPGTMFSRGMDTLLSSLKPTFPPPPGGQAVIEPEGIEPPSSGNTRQSNSNISTELALQQGSNIAYQRENILAEQADAKAAALEGAEGDDFLLGGAILDFLHRPKIQDMLGVMQEPKFIQGNFAYEGLGNIAGPYAEAQAVRRKSQYEAEQARLDREIKEADLAARREATLYAREQDRAQLGLARRRVELAEDPLPKPPTINKTTIEVMVDLIASLESNDVVDIDDLTGVLGTGILGQRESTVRQAIALRALEIQKNSPETSSADAIKQSIAEIRGQAANGATPSAPNGSISGATKGNLNISGDAPAIVN